MTVSLPHLARLLINASRLDIWRSETGTCFLCNRLQRNVIYFSFDRVRSELTKYISKD